MAVFGYALDECKRGRRITRDGWNGVGQWVAYMPPVDIPAAQVNARTMAHVDWSTLQLRGVLRVGGYFAMWTSAGVWQPGWTASQADMLAEDWRVLE